MKPRDSGSAEATTAERSRSSVLPADTPVSDGRVNRSVVTRKKIVSALTALVYEGYLSPTAEQVAHRAHIALRTVFRHFEDMDSLYREINSDLEALLMPMQSVRLVGDTWEDRLLHWVQLRPALYDRIAAMHLQGRLIAMSRPMSPKM